MEKNSISIKSKLIIKNTKTFNQEKVKNIDKKIKEQFKKINIWIEKFENFRAENWIDFLDKFNDKQKNHIKWIFSYNNKQREMWIGSYNIEIPIENKTSDQFLEIKKITPNTIKGSKIFSTFSKIFSLLKNIIEKNNFDENKTEIDELKKLFKDLNDDCGKLNSIKIIQNSIQTIQKIKMELEKNIKKERIYKMSVSDLQIIFIEIKDIFSNFLKFLVVLIDSKFEINKLIDLIEEKNTIQKSMNHLKIDKKYVDLINDIIRIIITSKKCKIIEKNNDLIIKINEKEIKKAAQKELEKHFSKGESSLLILCFLLISFVCSENFKNATFFIFDDIDEVFDGINRIHSAYFLNLFIKKMNESNGKKIKLLIFTHNNFLIKNFKELNKNISVYFLFKNKNSNTFLYQASNKEIDFLSFDKALKRIKEFIKDDLWSKNITEIEKVILFLYVNWIWRIEYYLNSNKNDDSSNKDCNFFELLKCNFLFAFETKNNENENIFNKIVSKFNNFLKIDNKLNNFYSIKFNEFCDYLKEINKDFEEKNFFLQNPYLFL